MKKKVALVLTLIMAIGAMTFCLTGCGDHPSKPPTSKDLKEVMKTYKLDKVNVPEEMLDEDMKSEDLYMKRDGISFQQIVYKDKNDMDEKLEEAKLLVKEQAEFMARKTETDLESSKPVTKDVDKDGFFVHSEKYDKFSYALIRQDNTIIVMRSMNNDKKAMDKDVETMNKIVKDLGYDKVF